VLDVGARRRAHADGERGLVGDHVEGDAAVELGDVHAHAAEAERADLALALPPLGEGDGEARRVGERRRLVVGARAVAAAAADGGVDPQDAAVARPGAARGRLADDSALDLGEGVALVRQKRAHHRAVALFVAGEGDRQIARRRAAIESREDGGDRGLGVAGAEPDDAAVADARGERIAGPAEVDRHGVDVRVDEEARRAPGRQRVRADGAVAWHLDDAHLGAALAQLVGGERAQARLVTAGVVRVDGNESRQQLYGIRRHRRSLLRVGERADNY